MWGNSISTVEAIQYCGGIVSVHGGITSVLWGITSVLWRLFILWRDSISTAEK